MMHQNSKFNQPNQMAFSDFAKLPPQAIDMERHILGVILNNEKHLLDVYETLTAEMFYREDHKEIYLAILELNRNSKTIDTLTCVDILRKKGKLEQIGGIFAITEIVNEVASSANIEYHAKIVAQKYIQREIIRISSQAIKESFEDVSDVFEILDSVFDDLLKLNSVILQEDKTDWKELTIDYTMDIIEKAKSGVTESGLMSGLKEIDETIKGFEEGLYLLAGRPSMGKCLGKGTKIRMFNGDLKNVEDIECGELIMGDDSTPRKILSLARGTEQMYWVRQLHGINYRVNESHILSLKRSRSEGGIKGEVLNISVSDYLKKNDKFKSSYKGYKVFTEYKEQPLPIDPYFIGLWIGDGSSKKPEISNPDIEVSNYLKEFADSIGLKCKASNEESKKCNSYSITKGYKGAVEEYSLLGHLKRLNLYDNKHIPKDYLINSKQNRLSLLAGLIDSDGHLNKCGGTYEITFKDEKLATQLKQLCDSLGYRTSLKSKLAKISSIGYVCKVWRVRFNGNVDEIPVKVERKKATKWTDFRDWTVNGISVEKDIVDEYYGFEIDGNRLFLLEDNTVTHNTAFGIELACRFAELKKGKVAFFSLEMSKNQLVNRVLSRYSRINQTRLRSSNIYENEFRELENQGSIVSELDFLITDKAGMSIQQIVARSKSWAAKNKISAIFVDYLQLVGSKSNKQRYLEVGEISKSLKNLSKTLQIPVIALAQLGREKDAGKSMPKMSELRESGDLEQDADCVMLLYRPEYYGIDADSEGKSTKDITKVIIEKNRNGSVNLNGASVRSNLAINRYEDIDASLIELAPNKLIKVNNGRDDEDFSPF